MVDASSTHQSEEVAVVFMASGNKTNDAVHADPGYMCQASDSDLRLRASDSYLRAGACTLASERIVMTLVRTDHGYDRQ